MPDSLYTFLWYHPCWAQAYFGGDAIFEGKTQNGKRTAGRKSNTCEESMQGMHVGKPNHIRVRVFVRPETVVRAMRYIAEP
jgi:hypothetical protein